MEGNKVLKFCKFYNGEKKCPQNVDYNGWFWERLVNDSQNYPEKGAVKTEEIFLGRIWDYMAKWCPYDCDEIYQEYLHKRQNFKSKND